MKKIETFRGPQMNLTPTMKSELEYALAWLKWRKTSKPSNG